MFDLSYPVLASQAAMDRSQISWSGPKCFGESAKGLCGNTNKRLVALAQHGVARAQTLFAPAQVTFGRLSVPGAKRPFAPPQGNFQSFVLNWPLSMALWFATQCPKPTFDLSLTCCGVQKWLRFRFYYLRDIYRNYFTGLDQLGSLCAVIPGYPRRANGDTQRLEARPELQDWLRLEVFTVKKLQDRALFEIIRQSSRTLQYRKSCVFDLFLTYFTPSAHNLHLTYFWRVLMILSRGPGGGAFCFLSFAIILHAKLVSTKRQDTWDQSNESKRA